MKKLFIGLLILAAGAGAFYYLQKEDKSITSNNSQQKRIIGKWKIDSLYFSKDSNYNFMRGIMGMLDSNLGKYHYEFTKDGFIFYAIGDSLIKDSSRYEWTNSSRLIWKEHPADTSGDIYTVSMPAKDSLVLHTADSTVLSFKKLR